MAEKKLGRELTPQEKQIVSSEGYSEKNYRDTKGVLTSGFGQTGEFMGMPLNEVAKIFESRTSKLIPAYDTLSEPLRLKLFDSTYRGGISGSPKALDLINKGQWKKAAAEFLDNKEYKEAVKSGSGVAKRMEDTANAMIAEGNKNPKQVVPKMGNNVSSFFQDIQDMGESFWEDIWGEDGDIVVENAKRAKQYKHIQGEYDPNKPPNHDNPNESNYIPMDSSSPTQFEDPWSPNYVEDSGIETFSFLPAAKLLRGARLAGGGYQVARQLLGRPSGGAPSAPPTPQQILNASRQAGQGNSSSTQLVPKPTGVIPPPSQVVPFKGPSQVVPFKGPSFKPPAVTPPIKDVFNSRYPNTYKPQPVNPQSVVPYVKPNGNGSFNSIVKPNIKDVPRYPTVYKPAPATQAVTKYVKPNMLRVASSNAMANQPILKTPLSDSSNTNVMPMPQNGGPDKGGYANTTTLPNNVDAGPQRPGYNVVRSGNGNPVKAGGGGYMWSKDYQHPIWSQDGIWKQGGNN